MSNVVLVLALIGMGGYGYHGELPAGFMIALPLAAGIDILRVCREFF